MEAPSGERLRGNGWHNVLCRLKAVWSMPERFRVVCTMQGAIQVLWFTFTFTKWPLSSDFWHHSYTFLHSWYHHGKSCQKRRFLIYNKELTRRWDTRTWPDAEIWSGALYPLRPRTRQNFICCCWRCLYNLRLECALPCSKNFRDKQEVLKLMSGHCAPWSLYRVTSYLQLLALFLSILTCSLNLSS